MSELARKEIAARKASSEVDTPFRLADRLALSIEEAAKALGVSPRHVRGLMPELPHVRLGGRVVFPVEGLREWLQKEAKAEPTKVDRAVNEVMASFEEDLHSSEY